MKDNEPQDRGTFEFEEKLDQKLDGNRGVGRVNRWANRSFILICALGIITGAIGLKLDIVNAPLAIGMIAFGAFVLITAIVRKIVRERKSRIGILIMLALLYDVVVKAWVMLVFGIIILAVAAFMAWKLFQVINKYIPPNTPNAPTNNINDTFYVTSVVAAAVSPAALPKKNGVAGFALQYGIGVGPFSWHDAWVSAGTTVAAVVPGVAIEIINTPDDYCVALNVGDYGYVVGNGTYSGPYGTTYPPETVVIERSTNMVDWDPIFTDSDYGCYSVRTFVDTDPPPDRAYYRLRCLGPTVVTDLNPQVK